MKVERRAHPRGEKGTRLSVHEAAKKATEGRLDPRTRAWAIEKLAQAGWPKGEMARASAILDGLRRERKYVPDPTDAEFMPSAACTLVGCEGLTFLGEDCDGLLIAYLAACGSIGIEGAVVGHGYSKDGQLSHVLAAVYDSRAEKWYLCDPSTKKAFGTVDKPFRERWVAVPSGAVICDSSSGQVCDPSKLGSGLRNLRPTGDFVGVGAPSDGSGNIGAPRAEASRYVLGDASQNEVMSARAGWDAEQVENAIYDMWIKHRELQIIREDYSDRPIAEAGAQELGRWTQADEAYYQELLKFGDQAVIYGAQASAKKRPVAWDTVKQVVAVLGSPEEPALEMDDAGNMSVGTTPGKPSLIVQSPFPGQVGTNPYLVVGGMVTAVVLGGLVYLSINRVCNTMDKQIDYAKAADLGVIHQNIAKTEGVEKANEAVAAIASGSSKKARAEAEKARAEGEPLMGVLKALETGAYIVVGVGVLGVLAYAGSKIWRSVQESRASRPVKRAPRQLAASTVEPDIIEAEAELVG